MPIYEYRCEGCGREFEKLRRMSDSDAELECPHCESPRVERVFSSFGTGGGGSAAGEACAAPSRGRFR